MSRRRMSLARRSRRLAAAVALAGLGGGLLSACSSGPSSAALARQACADVGQSITLYRTALHETGAAARHARATALVDLRQALRPAALAGSAGGQYQALQATLSESSRVPERDLVAALTAQCASVTPANS